MKVDAALGCVVFDKLAQTIGNAVQALLDQTADMMSFLVTVVAGIQELTVIKSERRDLQGGVWPQSVVG